MTLRLVHDPDTGCVRAVMWCPFVGEAYPWWLPMPPPPGGVK